MASIISLVFIIVIIKFVIKASKSSQGSNPIQKRASYVDNSNFEVNKPAKGTPKTTGVSREMRGGTTGSADINRNSEGKSFSFCPLKRSAIALCVVRRMYPSSSDGEKSGI